MWRRQWPAWLKTVWLDAMIDVFDPVLWRLEMYRECAHGIAHQFALAIMFCRRMEIVAVKRVVEGMRKEI